MMNARDTRTASITQCGGLLGLRNTAITTEITKPACVNQYSIDKERERDGHTPSYTHDHELWQRKRVSHVMDLYVFYEMYYCNGTSVHDGLALTLTYILHHDIFKCPFLDFLASSPCV